MAQETQENFYIDLAIQEYLKQHPITPEQIKAEYEQQIKQLGPKGTVVEYRLSIIVLNDEKQSLELLKRAKKKVSQH